VTYTDKQNNAGKYTMILTVSNCNKGSLAYAYFINLLSNVLSTGSVYQIWLHLTGFTHGA